MLRRSLRPVPSISSLASTSRHIRTGQVTLSETVAEAEILGSQPSFGELDAYPLRRASALCKATGGGRWEPKHSPLPSGYRIPGCKAPFELEMEREEAEARKLRLNPVVRDGGEPFNFASFDVYSLALLSRISVPVLPRPRANHDG